jgi:hypothetical protein
VIMDCSLPVSLVLERSSLGRRSAKNKYCRKFAHLYVFDSSDYGSSHSLLLKLPVTIIRAGRDANISTSTTPKKKGW